MGHKGKKAARELEALADEVMVLLGAEKNDHHDERIPEEAAQWDEDGSQPCTAVPEETDHTVEEPYPTV